MAREKRTNAVVLARPCRNLPGARRLRVQCARSTQTLLRYLYELKHGPITDPEAIVYQPCGNDSCIEHIELTTRTEHGKRSVARRRSFAGANNPNAKLTPAQVRHARERKEQGLLYGDITRMAREANVSKQAMSQVLRKLSW